MRVPTREVCFPCSFSISRMSGKLLSRKVIKRRCGLRHCIGRWPLQTAHGLRSKPTVLDAFFANGSGQTAYVDVKKNRGRSRHRRSGRFDRRLFALLRRAAEAGRVAAAVQRISMADALRRPKWRFDQICPATYQIEPVRTTERGDQRRWGTPTRVASESDTALRERRAAPVQRSAYWPSGRIVSAFLTELTPSTPCATVVA
jgi:hypothetical protein